MRPSQIHCRRALISPSEVLTMKRLIISVSIFALGLSTMAPNAYAACSGCNLVDNGDLGYIYAGNTVYIDNAASANEAVTVVDVDRNNYSVLVRHASGATDWRSARALYTSAKARERDNNTVVAGGLMALLGLAAIAGASSGNGGSNGSSNNSSGSNYNYDDDYYRRQSQPAPQDPVYKPDTSVGCAWGDRAYGTCH
jgi:hypothetical protein